MLYLDIAIVLVCGMHAPNNGLKLMKNKIKSNWIVYVAQTKCAAFVWSSKCKWISFVCFVYCFDSDWQSVRRIQLNCVVGAIATYFISVDSCGMPSRNLTTNKGTATRQWLSWKKVLTLKLNRIGNRFHWIIWRIQRTITADQQRAKFQNWK